MLTVLAQFLRCFNDGLYMPNSKRGGLPGLSQCLCFKSLLSYALRLNKEGLGCSLVVGAIGVHNTLSLVPCMLSTICYFMIVLLFLI